ncbi:MAG: hypothetical protein COU33_03325 [Candidatus Magasanikbacteria bacterium CG10_big_fil_rev_8_21_14_0_10_43_6]|uniref:Uncharacterized protein n=1 Tax=Candidatus Magasanikbacteria bacterium CG10_big_fil_rev_8_21_14_0_10_43_6 TaxID=1974650 RepID=A0A2M6W0S8_9BACT|nr:MAG: hypothetical protein COU33_03325 [Candidatus Magasanikbacteria bacterium CG10_big_fil_rev_8_21_14_0_10_43_6]
MDRDSVDNQWPPTQIRGVLAPAGVAGYCPKGLDYQPEMIASGVPSGGRVGMACPPIMMLHIAFSFSRLCGGSMAVELPPALLGVLGGYSHN